MNILVSNRAHLFDPPGPLREDLVKRLTLDNPKYLDAVKHDRWTGEIPRYLRLFEQDRGDLIVPRGFIRHVIYACRRHRLPFEIADVRRELPAVDFTFTGDLRPYQTEAVEAMSTRDFGTLSAPTGSGKTVMGLWMIAHRRQPALVVVHTRELLVQWVDRIVDFLDIPAEEVGVIGGGKCDIGDRVTVATVQTLVKCADEIAPHIGHLIVDECHRTPSKTFTDAVTAFPAKYMLGLSATPWRRDKLSRLIFWTIGDVVHTVDHDALVETGDVLRAEVIVRTTAFESDADPVENYAGMLSELTQDGERNRLIVADVVHEVCTGTGTCLVLTDRRAHCDALQALLEAEGVDAEVLTGEVGKRDRRRIVEEVRAEKVKVLIATGQLIGEGFDCPGLTTLFLATPIRFDGRVLQYLGRVLRPRRGNAGPGCTITWTPRCRSWSPRPGLDVGCFDGRPEERGPSRWPPPGLSGCRPLDLS